MKQTFHLFSIHLKKIKRCVWSRDYLVLKRAENKQENGFFSYQTQTFLIKNTRRRQSLIRLIVLSFFQILEAILSFFLYGIILNFLIFLLNKKSCKETMIYKLKKALCLHYQCIQSCSKKKNGKRKKKHRLAITFSLSSWKK